MTCNICKLKNATLIDSIEQRLSSNEGVLTTSDRKELLSQFPEYANELAKITDADCDLHWHFHQSEGFLSNEPDHPITASNEEIGRPSLAKDINKGEAEILFELMNKQAATFNCLTQSINKVLMDEELDITHPTINPNLVDFYDRLCSSIRATVKEIRDLNVTVNGSKSGAYEGLKALAEAIRPPMEDAKPLTTTKFDD